MALPASPNQLTFSQILQEKQGNTTARTDVSLKGLSVDGVADSSGGDISGTPNGTEPYGVGEFHGFSSYSWGTPSLIPSTSMQIGANRSSGISIGRAKFGFQYRPGSNIVRAIFQKSTSAGSGNFSGFNSAEHKMDLFSYTGTDPATIEVRCTYTGTESLNNSGQIIIPSDASGGTGSIAWTNSSSGFRQIAQGTSDDHTTNTTNLTNGSFTWGMYTVTCSSFSGSNSFSANSAVSGQIPLTITARAKDASGNVIATSNSATVNIFVGATKESGGGFGP